MGGPDARPKAPAARVVDVRLPAAVPALLLLLALLAGCSQADDKGPAAVERGNAPALHGAVMDPALRPLAGASVTIVGTNASTTTGSEGTYAFAELPRGQVLVITASHQGHVTASRQATLPDTGDLRLDIVLEPVPTEASYREVLKFDGVIGCQAAVAVSEEDARSVDCGGEADPGETVGTFAVAPKLVSAVVEVLWEPSTPAAEGLGARLEMPGTNTTLLSETVGRSPLRLVVPMRTAERLFADGGTLRLTVYAMPITDEDEQAAAASLAVDQPFQAFASLFYGTPPSPTYSILDEGG